MAEDAKVSKAIWFVTGPGYLYHLSAGVAENLGAIRACNIAGGFFGVTRHKQLPEGDIPIHVCPKCRAIMKNRIKNPVSR